jgi:hypothetical protein
MLKNEYAYLWSTLAAYYVYASGEPGTNTYRVRLPDTPPRNLTYPYVSGRSRRRTDAVTSRPRSSLRPRARRVSYKSAPGHTSAPALNKTLPAITSDPIPQLSRLDDARRFTTRSRADQDDELLRRDDDARAGGGRRGRRRRTRLLLLHPRSTTRTPRRCCRVRLLLHPRSTTQARRRGHRPRRHSPSRSSRRRRRAWR